MRRSTRRRSASPRTGSSRPASRAWTASSTRARDAALAKARELLPQIAGHQVWLFAATYRGEKVATASYDFDQLDLDGLHALAAEKDAVVLFKHHPFITHRIDVPEATATG